MHKRRKRVALAVVVVSRAARGFAAGFVRARPEPRDEDVPATPRPSATIIPFPVRARRTTTPGLGD